MSGEEALVRTDQARCVIAVLHLFRAHVADAAAGDGRQTATSTPGPVGVFCDDARG